MNTAALIWSLLAYSPLPTTPVDARDVLTAEDCTPEDTSCDDLRPWLTMDPHGSREEY